MNARFTANCYCELLSKKPANMGFFAIAIPIGQAYVPLHLPATLPVSRARGDLHPGD
jgi:hypothetical protein